MLGMAMNRNSSIQIFSPASIQLFSHKLICYKYTVSEIITSIFNWRYFVNEQILSSSSWDIPILRLCLLCHLLIIIITYQQYKCYCCANVHSFVLNSICVFYISASEEWVVFPNKDTEEPY